MNSPQLGSPLSGHASPDSASSTTSSVSSALSVPTQSIVRPKEAVSATTIHKAIAGVAPWPQKQSTLRPDGTAKTVFETSVFMVSEPLPTRSHISPFAVPSSPASQECCPRCQSCDAGGGAEPVLKRSSSGILKTARKFIITTTTTEIIQKTKEAGDAAAFSYSQQERIVEHIQRCPRAYSDVSRKRIRFREVEATMHPTYSREEYDRKGIDYVAKQLTPALALLIKMELNEVKRDMSVHQESAHMTQFYPIAGQIRFSNTASDVKTGQATQ